MARINQALKKEKSPSSGKSTIHVGASLLAKEQ
jgi:uncharacterized protein YbbK (DUF523 family)